MFKRIALVVAIAASGSSWAADFSGVWIGKYEYQKGADAQSVAFSLVLKQGEASSAIKGRCVEPNTFGTPDSVTLEADVYGLLEGDTLRFVKKYDGRGGQTHEIWYVGKLDADWMIDLLGIPVSATRRKCALLNLKVVRGAVTGDNAWPA